MTFFDDKAFTINDLVAAVIAIEEELGVTPSGVYADVRTRLDIVEARINNPLAPAPEVLNPFFIANTGVTVQAGFGDPNSNLALPPPQIGSLFLREDGYNNVYWYSPDGMWHQVSSFGPAGGDLGGNYPNPSVLKINGTSVPASPLASQFLMATSGTASSWTTVTGDASITGGVATVTGLQSRAVVATAPLDNYVLAWSASGNHWTPTPPSAIASPLLIELFNNLASSDVPGYDVIQELADGVEADLSAGGTSGSGNVLIKAFVTPLGSPDINIIPAGLWDFDFWAYVDSLSGVTNLVFDVYVRASGGAETLVFTATSPAITTTSVANYVFTANVGTDTIVPSTDRLVVKVSMATTSLTTVNAHFVFDGTTHVSHVHTPIPGAALVLGGDLSGTTGNANVINVHGASVPIAGALVTGNVLQVSGASALTYAPVNLAGGANFVTGTLPAGNQAAQTMGGDVTGTTAASVVAKIQGNPVSATSATAGQFLVENTSASGSAWTTLSGDVSNSVSTAGAITVTGIRNIPVLLTSLTSGQVLEYNGADWVNVTASSGVTWASDLVNSTNTNQYVSSLSFNGTAGGGTITINGTSTVLQWASNTLPQFNQATVAGTGTNNGVAFTVKAQAGQQQTGVAANNNGGNLVLASGSAGTGGSGAAGVAGNIQLNTDGVTQVTVSPTAVILAEKLNWATATVPNFGYNTFAIPTDANFTPSSSQYNASELAVTSSVTLTATRNLILPLTQGGQWIIYNNTTGGQSIQAIGTSGTGFTITTGTSAVVWTDGTNFYGVSGGGGGSFTAAGDLSGTSSSQTVIGLRNNSLPVLPGSGNNSLIWNGSTFSWSSLGTQTVRFTAPDSNTFLHWTLDESAAPFANTGTAGALNLTTATGTPTTNMTGLFGQAVGINASSGLTSGNTTLEPTGNSVTVSVWVYMKSFSGTFGSIFDKQYRNDGTYTAPFGSFFITESNTSDGQWNAGITVGGSNFQIGSAGILSYRLSLYTWMLISFTYDGSTLRVYLNGEQTGTVSVSGTIDFGTHGPYLVGGNATGPVPASNAIVDDVRVENTVRSQAYFQAMYKQGVGLADVVLISDAQVSPTAAIQGTKISPNFGSQAITTTGTATLGSTAVTSLSTSLITNSGKSVYTSISAPAVSGSGQAAIYFDSSSNQLLISQNAGNYTPVIGNAQVVSTTYLVLTTDSSIFANLNSSAFTVTLPATPARIGERHTFKDYLGKAATNNLTISGNGNNIEQFAGAGTAATLVLNSNFDAVTLEWNGTNWSIM